MKKFIIIFSFLSVLFFSPLAIAADFSYTSYLGDLINFGSYTLQELRVSSPTFKVSGIPQDLPTSYFVVFAPWGSSSSGSSASTRDHLTGLPAGSLIQITLPASSGLWTLSYTFDGGSTFTQLQLAGKSDSTSFFEITVPSGSRFAYVLVGSDLSISPSIGEFRTYLRQSNSIGDDISPDFDDAFSSLDIKFPSLKPVLDILDAITLDTASLALFSGIWDTFIPQNGTIYSLVAISLCLGVLGYVLFGRR